MLPFQQRRELMEKLIFLGLLVQLAHAFPSSGGPRERPRGLRRAVPLRSPLLSSRSPVILEAAALSRDAILRASRTGSGRKKSATAARDDVPPRLTRDLLFGALDEAVFRQERILDALGREANRRRETVPAGDDGSGEGKSGFPDEVSAPSFEEAKAQTIGPIDMRRLEVTSTLNRLLSLRRDMEKLRQPRQTDPTRPSEDGLRKIQEELVDMGFRSLLERDPATWLIRRDRKKEFGRPSGFDGLVFTSPAGVPIIVGRKGAHADGALRRVSQGSDLWFQVGSYKGSRVLLRTSMVRGLKGSRRCVQMAADLAAYYSDDRYEENVRVMYTDSRRVAKRGSKQGRMRLRKSLGVIVGHPSNVKDVAEGKEP